MSGDAHVRICESLGVQFPRATRLFVKIRGETHYLWRAVDHEGDVTLLTCSHNNFEGADLLKRQRRHKNFGLVPTFNPKSCRYDSESGCSITIYVNGACAPERRFVMNSLMEKVPVEKTERSMPIHKEWRPFESLREEVDGMFRGYGPDFWRMPERFPVFGREPFWGPMMGRRLAPPIDVIERDHDYEIMVELPGIEEKDVEVNYSDGMLTIVGEKEKETEEKEEGYLVSERHHGAFKRSFRLPETVDPTKIEARFEKGVLKVTLPMKPEARSDERKITVKAA